MQLRLREHLAKKFGQMKKTPNSVFSSPRAMAKLLKEAGRMAKILSANSEHLSQVGGRRGAYKGALSFFYFLFFIFYFYGGGMNLWGNIFLGWCEFMGVYIFLIYYILFIFYFQG